ncbi:MAG: sulfite exporter TauE/SafE family protein [Minwuia sp.]|uniref:sulfite exporter TauE/SafE family protein n=1 Tax=Minwuia sp. TaxID=2493630 RepID=UPI003A88F7A8
MEPTTWILAALPALLSGGIVGFSLGLIGGGGSILAVPLLIYAVGVGDTHLAIGTSAVAVAVSAFANLVAHWRGGNVKWPCAIFFAIFGVAGAALGSTIGKLTDPELLLGLFGGVMIVVGAAMLRRKSGGEDPDVHMDRTTLRRLGPRLAVSGTLVGSLAGFFGIGGGFLVVPGLVGATAMPLLNAVGSSLVSVAAFGATTAVNYALDGLVDWAIAGEFVAGGLAGGIAGMMLAGRLAGRGRGLTIIFSAVVIVVGIYVTGRAVLPLIS